MLLQELTTAINKKWFKLTLADSIILLSAFTLVGWSYVYYWWDKPQQAAYAMILVSGQEPLRVNLRQAQRIRVQGKLGESLLEVSDGKIRFAESACQNKQCIHASWLTEGGDFVACLPNQVSIAIYGKELIELDSIAY